MQGTYDCKVQHLKNYCWDSAVTVIYFLIWWIGEYVSASSESHLSPGRMQVQFRALLVCARMCPQVAPHTQPRRGNNLCSPTASRWLVQWGGVCQERHLV